MVRISRFVSVVTTFVLATAISIQPVGASPDTFTAAPGIITPTGPSILVGNLGLSYILPQVPLTGSVRVTLSRTSPASPSVTRIFQMGNSQEVNLSSIDPFASDLSIIGQSSGNISDVFPISDAMQVGVYRITVGYQNADGSAAATESISGITLTVRCDVGTYSTDGNVPVGSGCTKAPLGTYVSITGQTSATPCNAGYFAISLASTSCIPSPAGKFSAAGNGGVAPSDCVAGTYQPSQGQSSCLDAPAGTYVSETGAHATLDCVAGTFSASARSISCAQSPANFYVATVAATSATACPSNYTSPAGSDALSDCIAPAVATIPPVVKSSPYILKGKKRTIKSIAVEIKMSVPAKAKVTANVAKASKKFCVVSGSSIKALKRGTCVVTLKVKPTKGSAKTKAASITIR